MMRLAIGLCTAALLAGLFSACGGNSGGYASRDTTKASRIQAEASSSASENGEGPLDPDKDHDNATPDEDDYAKAPVALDRDGDSDNSTHSYYDKDDKAILDHGRPASAGEQHEIEALVKRYYAAAASENGAKACEMLYSTYAESVPEDYGTSPPGPAYARGSTCAAVLTHVFSHKHDEVASKLHVLHVARVRVLHRLGLAVLSFKGIPPSEMGVAREGKRWKVETLLDVKLP